MGGRTVADTHDELPDEADEAPGDSEPDPAGAALRERLGARSLVMVGLPGVGKSSVGRRLAQHLGLHFVDADTEIEKAAGMTISEIFAKHGEPAFREGEQRVIARLLEDGPQVLATGGGAYMAPETRAAIAQHGLAIWLDATTDVLVSRIAKRTTRPMFVGVDPRQKVLELRALRDPTFAKADIHVTSSAGPHERVVRRIMDAVRRHYAAAPTSSKSPCATQQKAAP